MQSISVFNVTGLFEYDESKIDDFTTTWTEKINGMDEQLQFQLFVNEKINNYVRFHIRMDEPFPIRARVHNQSISEVIITSTFDAFMDITKGNIIVLANKKSAERISSLVSAKFEIVYTKKIFDLQTIIQESSNVKKTQFRGLRIETINGSSLSGNRVTDTEMYRLMLDAGELSTIAVTYPFNGIEANFSISDSGSIVVFTTMDDEAVLDLMTALINEVT